MDKNLPEEIQAAIKILWDYSEDACMSSMPKATLDELGYTTEGDDAWFVRFVIPKDKG